MTRHHTYSYAFVSMYHKYITILLNHHHGIFLVVSFPTLQTAPQTELRISSYDIFKQRCDVNVVRHGSPSLSDDTLSNAKQRITGISLPLLSEVTQTCNTKLWFSLLEAFRAFNFDSIKTFDLKIWHTIIIQWLKIQIHIYHRLASTKSLLFKVFRLCF